MAARRSGLGRGLDALIPVAEGAEEAYRHIPLDRIVPNPQQPRTGFDEEGLRSLADSIREVGLLQPVVVLPEEEGRYVLVAGERRWRAARMAGLQEIPALVREGDESGLLPQALVENLQREDLSPLEEAAAYRQLLEDFGWSHEQIGQHVGKSRTTITNTLRLLQLPAALQGMVDRGELSAGHARALLALENVAAAQELARRTVEEGWSVRQLEEAVREAAEGSEEGRPARRGGRGTARPAPIVELEERLADRLGTKVRIEYRGKGGRLVIRFGSVDDLERIYRQFLGG